MDYCFNNDGKIEVEGENQKNVCFCNECDEWYELNDDKSGCKECSHDHATK